jgi:hypothetical protein
MGLAIGIDFLVPQKTQSRWHPLRRGFQAALLIFEFDRRAVSQRGMQPHLIVDLLDKLCQVVG